MTLPIVGAGMAGLLAANILKHKSPIVHEVQPSLPNNHSAVLRFRTSVVGDTLNIPFKPVKMLKSYQPWMNPIADSLSYANKCTGTYRNDRSIASSNFELQDRFIAPADLISRMAQGLEINFGAPFLFNMSGDEKVISTLPMPALMKLLKYENKPSFNYVPGINIRARIRNTDAYVTLYIPDPNFPFNRVSLAGDELIVEIAYPNRLFNDVKSLVKEIDAVNTARHALGLLGINRSAFAEEPVAKVQQYSKILPINEDERKRFIAWATDHYGIFSLGRFATWRPGLLLDDLVKDVRLIERFLNDRYETKRYR